jgi:hypothetical protein
MKRAALALEQQLAGFGLDIEVDALSFEELAAALPSGKYDMLIFFGDASARYWHFVLGFEAFTGFDSVELKEAVFRRDESAVRRILERERPFTTLFAAGEVIVTTSSVCNVHPRTVADFTWLADVRWCKPGEEH